MNPARPESENEASRQPALHFILWLMPVLVAAGIGAVASTDAARLYATLTLPIWAPPANLFAPAWSLLYLLMALAAWRIALLPDSPARSFAQGVFLIQLLSNAAWSWLFFAWKLGMWAFLDAALLLVLACVSCVQFMRLDRLAGCLLLPSVLWLLYATALSLAIWQRNPILG